MSECVVHMEIPTKDKACGMVFDFDGIWYCPVEKRICNQPDYREIPSWCPIICQLPEGHGRLVDADELKEWFIGQIDYYNGFYGALCSTMASAYEAVCELLDSEDTIVPAERSET